MVNQELVEIIAKRIATGGLNPLKGRPYSIEDVTNIEYRQAVIYLLKLKYDIDYTHLLN